jgi:hypothetical protein
MCLTIVSFLFCGCGPSSEGLEVQKGIDRTKRECQTSDLRTAVMPLYGKYNHYAGDRDEIPTAEIPEIISSLPVFLGISPRELVAFAPSTNKLMFTAGGGFGHWGIIICKDETRRTVDAVDPRKVALWKDGVFFYREFK